MSLITDCLLSICYQTCDALVSGCGAETMSRLEDSNQGGLPSLGDSKWGIPSLGDSNRNLSNNSCSYIIEFCCCTLHYANISTRKNMHEPGQCKHKRKHKKNELFPSSSSSCACTCVCFVMSYMRTGAVQAQAQEKRKYFLSGDKQTNPSSPIERKTAPVYVLVMFISLVWTSLCLSYMRTSL